MQETQLEGVQNPLGVRLLTYYLPQFHTTPENDAWHGEGFTEWTKVKAAAPLFHGHSQPRIPHSDVGYYTLDSLEPLKKQALMMRKAGITGTIFYHYRFGNKVKILEGPVEKLLESPDIDLPFCLAWCNENWTKRWDGGDHQVLLEQVYSVQDAEDFITELIPYFRDRRYIKVNGRPVVIVYRPHLVPNLDDYLDVWNGICLENDIPKPFVVASETWGELDFRTEIDKFDAVSEKPLYDFPQLTYLQQMHVKSIGEEHQGYIFNYPDVVQHYKNVKRRYSVQLIPSLSPSWDVSPRHAKKSLILLNDNAEYFQDWLTDCIERASTNRKAESRFVFINAWNEWAEGAYLEPDTRYGYAYLNAVASATIATESSSL